MEPEYLAQSGEPMPPDERLVWIEFHVEAAKAKGMTFFRSTYDEDHDLTLFEGWKERPEDQGEPRWQMSPTDVSPSPVIHSPPCDENR